MSGRAEEMSAKALGSLLPPGYAKVTPGDSQEIFFELGLEGFTLRRSSSKGRLSKSARGVVAGCRGNGA